MHALRVSLEENLLIWNLYSVLVFLLFENEFIPTFQNLKNKQKKPTPQLIINWKDFFCLVSKIFALYYFS